MSAGTSGSEVSRESYSGLKYDMLMGTRKKSKSFCYQDPDNFN